MAKHRGKGGKHSVHKSFPKEANPMDISNHPQNNLPTPDTGMGSAMVPGMPMGGDQMSAIEGEN